MKRLDIILVEKGLAADIKHAEALVMAGKVLIDDKPAVKSGEIFSIDSDIRIKGRNIPYVSRGGIKLADAVEKFDINIEKLICLDIGASTGGFTDFLLQNRAEHVFAVDVAYGQFAWKLRNDPRVTLIERTNIRYMTEDTVPYSIADLAVIDVSFISLKIVIPAALKFLKDKAAVIALIKPQFEAPRERVGKRGIVKDESVHNFVINDLETFFREIGLVCVSVIPSAIPGQKGNKEFFIYIKKY